MRDMELLQKICCRARGKEIDAKDTETIFEIKEYDQAAKCFKKLLRLEPKDAQAHFNLGNALLSLIHI